MKNLLINIMLSVFSVVIFFGFLEVTSRLIFSDPFKHDEYALRYEQEGVTRENKKSDEIRIFVVGESAVEGIPYSRDQSFPGYLQKIFDHEGIGNIRVVNAGIKGRHSYYQLEQGKSLVAYGADIVVIYAGNNDTRDFSNVMCDVPLAWLDFKLYWNSRFYAGIRRKITALKDWVNQKRNAPVFQINHNQDDVWHWADTYIAKKKQYMENPKVGLKRKQLGIEIYQKNLEALIIYLRKHGVQVFVSSLGIAHEWEPGISDVKIGIGPGGKGYEINEKLLFHNSDEEIRWHDYYRTGENAIKEGRYQEAIEALIEAEKIDEFHPMVQFYLGTAYQKLGFYKEAKERYLKAKELEIQSAGGSPGKNQALQAIAAKLRVPFIPMQTTLESVSPNGIVGKNLFLDHCHYNVLGNKIVASRIMEALCENAVPNCAGRGSWKSWFEKITNAPLDDKNLAREYLSTGFYLINGSQWSKDQDFEGALFYLKEAQRLDSSNVDIYPLLALTYWKLGQRVQAREALLALKSLSMSKYDAAVSEYQFLKQL